MNWVGQLNFRSFQVPSVIAIVAHPDDIEFLFAGTMLQLAARGWDLHYMNISSGNCGSIEMNSAVTRKTRKEEAMKAAYLLGAKFHPSICDDLEIVYSVDLLRQLASVIRTVKPDVVLTHSTDDYMIDHMETARLAVTATFSHGMPNFKTEPMTSHLEDHNVSLYHAMPHGLVDSYRKKVIPEAYVDITSVIDTKRSALAEHHSQHSWLEASQGMNSYLKSMDEMSEQMGLLSGKFKYAEGWRRRLHIGFSKEDQNPLKEALGDIYYSESNYFQND